MVKKTIKKSLRMKPVPIKFPARMIKDADKWLKETDMTFAAACRLGLRLLMEEGYTIKRGIKKDV